MKKGLSEIIIRNYFLMAKNQKIQSPYPFIIFKTNQPSTAVKFPKIQSGFELIFQQALIFIKYHRVKPWIFSVTYTTKLK